MSEQNARTLQSYDDAISAYWDATDQLPNENERQFIELVLKGLDPKVTILEIGSGTGRDANYMQRLGYDPVVTDASQGFVDALRKHGHDAKLLNIITDQLEAGRYDVVYANAVFVHFGDTDFSAALENIGQGLKLGGRFGMSLLQGEGDKWTDVKINEPRYFRYQTKEDIDNELARAGFAVTSYREVVSSERLWMDYICEKVGLYE